jgi:hypothetical protein
MRSFLLGIGLVFLGFFLFIAAAVIAAYTSGGNLKVLPTYFFATNRQNTVAV